MTSIPSRGVHHVEDFGHILLHAQAELEAVRGKLEGMPTIRPSVSRGDGNDAQEDALDSLKELLSRTQSKLRQKAELVLKSVEDANIRGAALEQGQSMEINRIGDVDMGGFGSRMNGYAAPKYDEKRQMASMVRSRQKYIRRPVMERQQEARALQMLSRPEDPAAQAYLKQKYRIPQKAPSLKGAKQRPIASYGSKKGSLHKYQTAPLPMLQPSAMREDSHAYPDLTPEDTSMGVLNLIEKGLVPSFVDFSPIFESGPAPLSQQPAVFHNFYEQFNKTVVADHDFPVSNLRLDLTYGGDDDDDTGDANTQRADIGAVGVNTLKQLQAAKKLLSNTLGYDETKPPTTLVNLPTKMFDPQIPGEEDLDEPEQEEDKEEDAEDVVRDYDTLLDAYSLHQFIIRKGKTLANTPEFKSFERKYRFLWGAILDIIAQLELLLKRFGVPMAYVSGQAIVALADAKGEPTPEALVECLLQIDKAALIAKLKGYKYYGDEGKNLAAAKIQATWNMSRTRKIYLNFHQMSTHASTIQRAWRAHKMIVSTRETASGVWKRKLRLWRHIQSEFKSHWNLFSTSPHVIIHVPSLSFHNSVREALFNFPLHENNQLTRLFDLGNELCDVVYIAPFPINADVLQYYLKLLQVAGVTNAQKRLKILVPENRERFPEHFSVSKMAFYSPQLLKQLRQFVRGRPAYICPRETGPEDLHLAVHLGYPIMSAEPEVSMLYSTKSGAKRLFAIADVKMAPGLHDIYDKEDLYEALSRLIVEHLDVKTWILKIDNRCGGQGIAYFKPSVMKEVAVVKAEKTAHPTRFAIPEIFSEAQSRVMKGLRTALPRHAVVAVPFAFDKSWDHFLYAYLRVGGIIEGAPSDIVSSPSANLWIEPDGTINLLNSHTQLFSSPYVFAGSVFPASCSAMHLYNAATKIARAAYDVGVIGYVGIDFVEYTSQETKKNELMAVDLNLRITDTLASFKLFDFLMKGEYVHPHRSLHDDICRYEIPDPDYVHPHHNDTKKLAPESEIPKVNRYYVSFNNVCEPHLSSLQFVSFFNLCRMQSIAFDLRSKTGTAFMLWDSLASGVVGVLSVMESQATSMTSAIKALTFLSQQTRQLRSSQPDEMSNLDAITAAASVKMKELQEIQDALDEEEEEDRLAAQQEALYENQDLR